MTNGRQMMRGCMLIAFSMMAMAAVGVGCSKEEAAKPFDNREKATQPVVYVSNYPLEYMAKRIAGPLITVRFPVPAGEDPAFWKPTPADILAMQKADLIVLNGASYESWLGRVSLAPSKLLDSSALLGDRLLALGETQTHAHGPEGEHQHAGTAFTTWLDLTIAFEQARAIKKAFAARWPEHRDRFETEFDKLTSDLENLDKALKSIPAGNPKLPVVFSHPVYQYLERRYGLNGRSVHFEPDVMPSDAAWQNLVALVETHPAKWMIWEKKPLPEIAEQLKSMGIESIVFDPCGGQPENGDFLSVMQRNLTELGRVYE